eukprot:GHVS01088600.1.p1 GENE.GHVS01088600.1~~GHVS01088600.1.p1  ORF type:complete len:198 (+),score=38.60 GHVS01088600.1:109-702(+)
MFHAYFTFQPLPPQPPPLLVIPNRCVIPPPPPPPPPYISLSRNFAPVSQWKKRKEMQAVHRRQPPMCGNSQLVTACGDGWRGGEVEKGKDDETKKEQQQGGGGGGGAALMEYDCTHIGDFTCTYSCTYTDSKNIHTCTNEQLEHQERLCGRCISSVDCLCSASAVSTYLTVSCCAPFHVSSCSVPLPKLPPPPDRAG